MLATEPHDGLFGHPTKISINTEIRRWLELVVQSTLQSFDQGSVGAELELLGLEAVLWNRMKMLVSSLRDRPA